MDEHTEIIKKKRGWPKGKKRGPRKPKVETAESQTRYETAAEYSQDGQEDEQKYGEI